jgi:hypothetical protein
MAKAAIWAICLFPIWGSLLPLLIPRTKIDALSAAIMAQHADSPEEAAFIKEDRA